MPNRNTTSGKIKNVVFLTIDCLKYSFLRPASLNVAPCPTINRLAEGGLLWANARSHSIPTQISFPSIFSSTLPLDNGGYDSGVRDRPITLAEKLSGLGMKTIGVSTSPWLGRKFGYQRGFDEFHEVFDVNKLWVIYSSIYLRFYRLLYENKQIGKNDFIETISRYIQEYLEAVLVLISNLESDRKSGAVPKHPNLHRLDLPYLRTRILKLLREIKSSEYAMSKAIDRADATLDLMEFVTGSCEHSVLYKYYVKMVDHVLQLVGGQLWRDYYSVPASYLEGVISSKIKQNAKEPFFIWTHFLDIHEGTFIKGPAGFPPEPLRFGSPVLMSDETATNKRNYLSLRFIDQQLARILNTLERHNLKDSTLLVISGDHGIGKPGVSLPGCVSEEATRVPVIYHNKHISARVVNTQCGLIDIAPTILAILGCSGEAKFCGKARIDNDSDHDYVYLESLGPGPGDFRHKAIKIAVIKGRYKLIALEPVRCSFDHAEADQLFDLKNDPTERCDLYGEPRYRAIVEDLRGQIDARIAQIRRS